LHDKKSLGSKPEEPQYGALLLLSLLATLIEVIGSHGFLLLASAFLGLFEMVEDGAFGYAEHVPDAIEIGLILILHALQTFVDGCDPLLYGFHLQLDKGGDALVE
jgi:hypothetical protein